MSKNAFAGRSSSDPGMVLPQAGAGDVVSLRVYNEKAVVSPGVLYKAIRATSEMTASQVIKQVLERFGEENLDPNGFELQYNVVPETKKSKRLSFRGSKSSKRGTKATHVLDNDEAPVLVAEWFSDETRRFELHPKPIRPTKRSRSSKNFIMVPPTQSEMPSISEEQPAAEKSVVTKSGKEQPYFTYMADNTRSVHLLAEGTTLVGSGKQADLILEGADIKFVHFEVINMRNRIALVPSSGSALYVEGKLIDKPVVVQNGAHIAVGRSKTHNLELHAAANGGEEFADGAVFTPLDAGAAVEIYSALKQDAQQRVTELSESYRQGLRDGMDLVAAVIDDEDYQFRDEETNQELNISTVDNLAVEFLEVSDLRASPSILGQRLINEDPMNNSVMDESVDMADKPPLKSSDSLVLQQNDIEDEEC